MKLFVGLKINIFTIDYVITEVNEEEGYIKLKPVDKSLENLLVSNSVYCFDFNKKFRIVEFIENYENGVIEILPF